MTPGTTLAAKRGEGGLTIEQVSSATRIRAEHLSALESDQRPGAGAGLITSGTAAATFIAMDGRALGALGSGVATREFSSSQTSQ